MRFTAVVAAAALALGSAGDAWASNSSGTAHSLLWIAIVIVAAKLGGLVERLGQPAVLGEILAGVALSALAVAGLGFSDAIRSDQVIRFLAELGAVILLFQIGLESNVRSMRAVGARAFWVAIIGVAAPFALGSFVVGPLLLPGLPAAAYLFLGAALTATSVGITGRVFRDAGALGSPEAQIVLGAAVIDDVLGLMVLALVSAIATQGVIDASALGITLVQAFGFLGCALLIGQAAAPWLSRAFSVISRGAGMKLTVALALCLTFAYLAHVIGLAPIVGAFAAGLILDEVHFRSFDAPRIRTELVAAVTDADAQTRQRVMDVAERSRERHLEELVAPVGHLLVPIFFLFAGLQVDAAVLADPSAVALALMLTAAAVAGKLVAGAAAGGYNRWLVGWGMVPRGEVGLIFAFVGKELGVLDHHLFSVIVLMVLCTTLITPPMLAILLRRKSSHETSQRPARSTTEEADSLLHRQRS
jgi:Kef-type K+ transport system membrane component KefB